MAEKVNKLYTYCQYDFDCIIYIYIYIYMLVEFVTHTEYLVVFYRSLFSMKKAP